MDAAPAGVRCAGAARAPSARHARCGSRLRHRADLRVRAACDLGRRRAHARAADPAARRAVDSRLHRSAFLAAPEAGLSVGAAIPVRARLAVAGAGVSRLCCRGA